MKQNETEICNIKYFQTSSINSNHFCMLHKNPDAFQIEVILMSWNFCILKDA